MNDSKIYGLFKCIVGDVITCNAKPQKTTSLRSAWKKYGVEISRIQIAVMCLRHT